MPKRGLPRACRLESSRRTRYPQRNAPSATQSKNFPTGTLVPPTSQPHTRLLHRPPPRVSKLVGDAVAERVAVAEARKQLLRPELDERVAVALPQRAVKVVAV